MVTQGHGARKSWIGSEGPYGTKQRYSEPMNL